MQQKQQSSTGTGNNPVIDAMLNKIKMSNVSVKDFVEQLYRFHEAAQYVTKYYPINSNMTHVFNQELVSKALDAINKQRAFNII